MSGVQSIYEKMLKNPANRKISRMKQPTPFDGHDKSVSKTAPEKIDPDDSFFRAIDRRMANKENFTSVNESLVDQASVKKITKLEKKIDELEKLVIIMMKQQMKLMKD